MADAFDPYRKWLGIPEDSRPPTHYQLLAISPTEKDRDVIELAVIRQSAFVRNYQKGPNSEAASRLLNEIAAAKACLLDPEKRAKYDAGLKPAQPAPARPSARPAQPSTGPARRRPTKPGRPVSLAADLERLASAASATDPSGAGRGTQRKPTASGGLSNPVLIGGAAAGATILILLLVILFSGKSGNDTAPVSAPPANTAPTNGVAIAEPIQSSASTTIEKTAEPSVALPTAESTTKTAASAAPTVETANAPTMPTALADPPAILVTQRWSGNGEAPDSAVAPFDAEQARAYQVTWAKYLGATVESMNSIGMRLILLPPGEFQMGSTDAQVEDALKSDRLRNLDDGWQQSQTQKSERPPHSITFKAPLLVGATEVTVGQFRQFVKASKYVTLAEKFGGDSWGVDPAKTGNTSVNWRSPGGYVVKDNSPVNQVTWRDACAMCNWLSEHEKLPAAYQEDAEDGWTLKPDSVGYRLPTEAEWEYACRAGTDTQYSFGDDPKELEKYAWIEANSGGSAHPVGLKKPNPFGLYDMHGNVEEWCQDYFAPYSAEPESDPQGPPTGKKRLLRSCHFKEKSYLHSRSAFRNDWNPTTQRYNLMGFRVVRSWPSDISLLVSLKSTPRSVTIGAEPGRHEQTITEPNPAEPPPRKAKDEWQTLFNGKDLTGWEVVDAPADSWKAINGILVTAGQGNGWLSTKYQFADFELDLEFRVPPGGNSGIFIRSPHFGNPAMTGIEIQVLDDAADQYKSLKKFQYCGSIYDVVAATPGAAKPANRWQSCHILCERRKVQVTLNRVMVVDANLDDYASNADKHPGLLRTTGFIGLQNHGTPLAYRNIRVRRL